MIRTSAAFLLLSSISMALPASGQESLHPSLDDRFTFKLGFLSNEADGEITFNRPPLPETPISLDDLGVNGSTESAWAAFRWRFKEKWSLNLMYNRFERESDNYIESPPFNFDGQEYTAGARIKTDALADAYILNLGYSFVKKPNYEIGVGVGLHAFDFKIKLDGQVNIGDAVSEVIPAVAEELIAPVPNVRLFGSYAFNPKLLVKLDSGWLSLEYDDYGGGYLYASAGVDYRFTQRFGIGVAYQYTDLDFEYDTGDKKIEYNMTFDGLSAFVSYSF